MAIYRRMEDAGMLHVFEAADSDGVIGFIVIVTTELPNYSCTMTATDSFFVTRAKRFSGAGLKLLRKAEAKARSLGSPGLGVSASTGSRLAEILPRMGFVESNVVFFKRFNGTHLDGGMNGGS
jgi:GNAT superfamily N-acetyltransferase